MGFVTSSDALIEFALLSAYAALALTLTLILVIVLLRLALHRRARHQARTVKRWQPSILQAALAGVPAKLPVLRQDESEAFLGAWLKVQESVRGASRDNLNHLCRTVGGDRQALQLIDGGDHAARLIAVSVLGWLGERDSRRALEQTLHDANPVLSLTAARALIRIDAAMGVEAMMAALEKREDWPLAGIGSLLAEAGTEAVTSPLMHYLEGLAPRRKPAGLRLLRFTKSAVAIPLLHRALSPDNESDVLSAALKEVHDPRLRPSVLPLINHENWQVRVQAIAALGRIADPTDVDLLLRALGDPAWWVRYRAAKALAALPDMDQEKLARILAGLRDRFARDMLGQVMAERKLS